MKLSDEDLDRVRARRNKLVQEAELAEKEKDYQKASDLWGELADQVIGKDCRTYMENQRRNFLRLPLPDSAAAPVPAPIFALSSTPNSAPVSADIPDTASMMGRLMMTMGQRTLKAS